MNILFLSLVRYDNVEERGIYADLIRKFAKEGHRIVVIFPSERKYAEASAIDTFGKITICRFRSLNIQKTGYIEKGIATLLLEWQFIRTIRKYCSNIKFDCVLYSTPPITLGRVVSYVKKRDKAVSYLLLKDIFPQNAVDLGLIAKGSYFYKYFKNKERHLYSVSDFIGCMSQANVDYLLSHNPLIARSKVEINPNSIEPVSNTLSEGERDQIFSSYSIPSNSVKFIYGGNLGIPQGIDFLIEVLISNSKRDDCFFLIVGDGTEYSAIDLALKKHSITNAKLIRTLPKKEFDRLVASCDVGLIFLDKKFTIPNFPSRILSYLQAKKPVLAATDLNTDIGSTLEAHHFGIFVPSGELELLNNALSRFIANPEETIKMGNNGYRYMLENFHTDISYQKIIDKL